MPGRGDVGLKDSEEIAVGRIVKEGELVGRRVGNLEGPVGLRVGLLVGGRTTVGLKVGFTVGLVGWAVGFTVGLVGIAVGERVGLCVGSQVGLVGLAVGSHVGLAVGEQVGALEGLRLGAGVTASDQRRTSRIDKKIVINEDFMLEFMLRVPKIAWYCELLLLQDF